MTKKRPSLLILLAAVLLILGGSVLALRVRSIQAAHEITGMEELEERWGIQITMLGVTADGGMLDLRYRMIDPSKVIDLQELETEVVFIVEKDGYTFRAATAMNHRHDAQIGLIYSMLYFNQNGAVHPGDLVTVQIGDVQVRHVPAQ
jgi:hypothetical protein